MHTSRFAALLGALAITASVGAVPVAAESESHGKAVHVEITCDDVSAGPAIERSVDAPAGHTVEVHLCSNPTTGFRWSTPVSSVPEVATVSDWDFEEADSDMPGAPGVEHLTIDALAPGSTTISSTYDQPWDGGMKGAATLSLTVNVGTATTVAIDCAAFEATPNATASVEVAAGDMIVVSLCSNPTTGFRWGDPVVSDSAVVEVDSWVYESPASDMMGASGTEHIVLHALSAGTATVSGSYGRPWEGGEQGVWTVELSITVS